MKRFNSDFVTTISETKQINSEINKDEPKVLKTRTNSDCTNDLQSFKVASTSMTDNDTTASLKRDSNFNEVKDLNVVNNETKIFDNKRKRSSMDNIEPLKIFASQQKEIRLVTPLKVIESTDEEKTYETTIKKKTSKYTNAYSGQDYNFSDDISGVQQDLLPEVCYAIYCENCKKSVEVYTKKQRSCLTIVCMIICQLLIWTVVGAIILFIVCKDKNTYVNNYYCPDCNRKIGSRADYNVSIRGIDD